VEGGHGHESIFDAQARTVGGPAWCDLKSRDRHLEWFSSRAES
jgi:hypothetical protein